MAPFRVGRVAAKRQPDSRPDRPAGRLAAVLLLLATPVLAQVPGDERAVPVHLDHAGLAAGALSTEDLIAAGERLFTARFATPDGAGRPAATAAEVPTRRRVADTPGFFRTSGPDANACAGCHVQPAVGGAGDFAMNVFVAPQDIEWDFETVAPDLSMERGTTHLFGAGLLELLAREMTADLQAIRADALGRARAGGASVTAELVTKGVSFGTITATPEGFVDVSGVDGVHPDLVVKPFGQKGVTISLRQFSVTGFNTHHGMQPAERFGRRWTGVDDFDEDGHVEELTEGDITAATLFQASLPPPGRAWPDDPVLRDAAERGQALFAEIGCAACHRPSLPLDSAVFTEPGPYNPAGTLRAQETGAIVAIDLAALWGDVLERDDQGRLLVPAFTDLRRHVIADAERPFYANELITQNFVPRDRFRTAPLWGVGSTAPYGHRGDVTTLDEAIRQHGGAGTDSRRAYEALDAAGRGAVVEFLKTLVIVP